MVHVERGNEDTNCSPLRPSPVPFLLNLLYFFGPSECLVKRDCVRADETAQTQVSRGFRGKKKEVPVRGGGSDSTGQGT